MKNKLKAYPGGDFDTAIRSNLEWRLLYSSEGEIPVTGIQFVTDAKGRKVAVQIDLKRYGAVLEDFWDGIISESRRTEKGVPLDKIKADLVKRGRLRG